MKLGVIEQLNSEVIREAKLWCKRNLGWVSIVDIKNIEELYESFEEISIDKQMFWKSMFGESEAIKAYKDYSVKRCKYDFGFVNIKGEFYKELLEVPLGENVVTVYNLKK